MILLNLIVIKSTIIKTGIAPETFGARSPGHNANWLTTDNLILRLNISTIDLLIFL